MKTIFFLFFCLMTLCANAAEPTQSYIIIKDTPPGKEQSDTIPPSPGPDHIWVRGRWKWDNNNRFDWVTGHWEKKPHPAAVWIPGHWRQKPGYGWLWVDGHWE